MLYAVLHMRMGCACSGVVKCWAVHGWAERGLGIC